MCGPYVDSGCVIQFAGQTVSSGEDEPKSSMVDSSSGCRRIKAAQVGNLLWWPLRLQPP